jgi:WD40 repeat protein/DNA-binding SARP family transcriptional activator/energy-coupling factor transporter ATP-binding protein EcfA2
MRIGVLGPLTVDGATGAVGPRDRVVLAALVTRYGDLVTTDQLADALWGDDPPASWAKVVQGCIARLRRTLGHDAILTEGHAYRLAVPPDDVDALRFERSITRVEELLALDDPHRAVYVADEALALWRGQPLSEVGRWEPARIEAERLEERRRDAEELRLDALLRAGRWRSVVGVAQAHVAEAPMRERRWCLLALAQHQAGRQGEALATLRRARATLVDGLGLDPGPEIAALEAAILRQDTDLLPAPDLPDPTTACPYLGLVPYDVEDADRFFGRRQEVHACLARLAQHDVLVVVGPSGSGKSSLIRAGIAAALQRDGRRVVIVTPGAYPLDALTALPTPVDDTVLVVDQCEEAVTLCDDGDARDRFFEALVRHAAGAPLVVALRADRLGELTTVRAFARLVEDGLYLLPRMDETELRAAIEGPARQAGLLLEPGLVDVLVQDVEDEPGALPLLSHALRETWLGREGRTLTVEGYRSSGGIRGAVARTAEQVYEQAPAEQRPLLRDLLLRLVVPSPEGEPVRGRVPRRTLATDAAHEQVIELLVAARLVTSDEDVVELAHEALTRAWPRLRSWLDDDVDGQRILRHLAATADGWEMLGRPDSELYRGVRLTAAAEWRDRSAPDLTPTERAFLDVSERRADTERQAAQRRRRRVVASLAAATVVSLALGAAAVVQARQAAQQRDVALAAEGAAEEARRLADSNAEDARRASDLARARELAASALTVVDEDPELSLLLAFESALLGEPSPEAIRAVRQALLTHQAERTITWEDTELVRAGSASLFEGALSPDGRLLVVGGGAWGGTTGNLELWDLEAGRRLWVTPDTGGNLGRPVFTADAGRLLVPVYTAKQQPAMRHDVTDVRLDPGILDIDVGSGEVTATVALDVACPVTRIVTGPAVDPDATLVVASDAWLTGCAEGTTVLAASLADGSTTALLEAEQLRWAATSHDGRLVAISAFDTGEWQLLVLDVDSGQAVLDLADEELCCASVSLSPDGDRLLTASTLGPAQLWDTASGEAVGIVEELGRLTGEEHTIFDASGSVLLSGGRRGSLHLYDESSGRTRAFPGHRGEVFSVAMSADGARGVSFGSDGTGRVWRLTDPGEVAAFDIGTAGFYPADGLSIAGGTAAAYDAVAPRPRYIVFDPRTGEVTATVTDVDGQRGRLSPDGRLLAYQAYVDEVRFGPIRLHDLTDGSERDLQDPCELPLYDAHPECDGLGFFPGQGAWDLAFSPDGRWLAFGGWGGDVTALVWDTRTGQLVHDAGMLVRGIVPVVFDPSDGAWLAVSLLEELVVYDTDDWSELARVPAPDLPYRALRATADGTLVGATDGSGELQFLDARTLEHQGEPLRGNDGRVTDIEISPDGTLLAAAGDDGIVRLWELPSRRLVHALPAGLGGAIQNVAFLDDVHLAVTARHGSVVVLTLDPTELMEIAGTRVTRGLSEEECETYGFEQCPAPVLASAG